MKYVTLAALAVFLFVGPALAQFNLQITEIWMGNEPGSNITADWFEVTNVGDASWTAAVDGDLYYDDDSQDATAADLLSGVASIAPGESVVFINDTDTSEFASVWSNVVLPQLGTFDGSGLGQGGDAVTLFLSFGPPTGLLDIIDFEGYPDANLNGGQSYDVNLAAFSTVGNASGALRSALANDMNQFGIASIGPAVPEPASALLWCLLATGTLARRRR